MSQQGLTLAGVFVRIKHRSFYRFCFSLATPIERADYHQASRRGPWAQKKAPPKQRQFFVELKGSAITNVATSISQLIGVSAVNDRRTSNRPLHLFEGLVGQRLSFEFGVGCLVRCGHGWSLQLNPLWLDHSETATAPSKAARSSSRCTRCRGPEVPFWATAFSLIRPRLAQQQLRRSAATKTTSHRDATDLDGLLQQVCNQVAGAASLKGSPFLKPMHEMPRQGGADPGRFAAQQLRCGHGRASSPLGLKRWSHQSNVSWVGHGAGC
jgi:hypothetical protein